MHEDDSGDKKEVLVVIDAKNFSWFLLSSLE